MLHSACCVSCCVCYAAQDSTGKFKVAVLGALR